MPQQIDFKNNCLSYTIGLIIILSPLKFLYSEMSSFLLTAIVSISMAFILYRKSIISISNIDIIVIFYLLYGLVNALFVKSNNIDTLFIYNWLAIIMTYTISRNIKSSNYTLYYLLTVSGVIQSCIGLSQTLGFINSNNSNFLITGSFQNPGPYAGFILLSLFSTIYLIIKSQNKSLRIILFISLITILSAFIISNSRAAFLAGVVSLIYFSYNYLSERYKKFVKLSIRIRRIERTK